LPRATNVVPIPWTKRRTCLEDNIGALDIEPTAVDRARIGAELPQAAGDRHDRSGMPAINR
jgi:diketogulonate reductase-like aldo/keto reductase